MKTKTLVLMIIALSLLAAGLIVACIGASFMNFDFLTLNTAKSTVSTHNVTEEFHSIAISEKTSDIVFLPSEDGSVKVVCNEQKKMTHAVSVQNGVLTVKLIDSRKWYDHITLFNFGNDKTTVYLPKGAYESLSIKTNTGDIKIPDGYAFERASLFVDTGDINWQADVKDAFLIDTDTGDVKISNAALGSLKLETDTGDVKTENINGSDLFDLETSTGDIRMQSVTCGALKLETDTGDVTLTDTVSGGHAKIDTDTGDVKFVRADAATLDIETDTGDVTGSLRSAKIFYAKSGTGKVNVPQSTAGGLCNINCGTGDIRITIEGVN